jgi:hypothetical protein
MTFTLFAAHRLVETDLKGCAYYHFVHIFLPLNAFGTAAYNNHYLPYFDIFRVT